MCLSEIFVSTYNNARSHKPDHSCQRNRPRTSITNRRCQITTQFYFLLLIFLIFAFMQCCIYCSVCANYLATLAVVTASKLNTCSWNERISVHEVISWNRLMPRVVRCWARSDRAVKRVIHLCEGSMKIETKICFGEYWRKVVSLQ